MDSSTPSIDFAVIGHQDSWQHIAAFINGIRTHGQDTLPDQEIKNIFSLQFYSQHYEKNYSHVCTFPFFDSNCNFIDVKFL